MNKVSEITLQYEQGLPILQAFMEMTDAEIKAKVKSIGGSDIPDNGLILGENSDVHRSIRNEKPEKITIAYYDKLVISPWGINFESEHGHNNKKIATFNQHFKL